LAASAAAEAASGSDDAGHDVRDGLMLLRRHCGKLAAALLLAVALRATWIAPAFAHWPVVNLLLK
jgi:hypothetical protein